MATTNEPDDEDFGGPGPEVWMRVTWSFSLGKRDSLLMLKALGGRLKGKEVEEARELGDRLSILRARIADEQSAHLQHVADNIKRAREQPSS